MEWSKVRGLGVTSPSSERLSLGVSGSKCSIKLCKTKDFEYQVLI